MQDLFTAGSNVAGDRNPGIFFSDEPIGDDVRFNWSGQDRAGLARETMLYIRA